MPYITQERRDELEFLQFRKVGEHLKSGGELTYVIYQIIMDYLISEPVKFERLCICLGALQAAKMEFYRRIVSNYEDIKIKENGDIWTT